MGVTMKKVLSLILIISFPIYFGCSNNLVSPAYTNSNNFGQVTLKISSDSIPNNIVKVTAILSKSGEDTLTTSVEPISGSSANLNFTNVPVGSWHLKVNAENNNGLILYTGNTDIQVNDGEVTNVSLTLIQTDQGTGSIFIQVNWGNSNTNWIDYSNNPVLSVKDIPYFTLSVDQGQVFYDDGIYKMWFMNLYYNGRTNISYAESNDGLIWHLGSSEPVLTAGQPGDWDDNSVEMGYVFKENGSYKLYYVGTREPHTGMRQIGLAISQDGINWEKYPDPVLESDSSQWYLGIHAILKINNVYYMYYDASPENEYTFNINLATSSDGIHWTKYKGNPILTANQSWEQGSIEYPTITNYKNRYMMTYTNGLQKAVGAAYSDDGIIWNKESNNPVFTLTNIKNNWCTKISYPYLLRVGNEFRVYYSGYGTDNQFHLAVAFGQ